MAIPVQFYTMERGGQVYAFKPESISFNDGESLDIKINANGNVNTVQIKQREVTLTLEGARDVDLQAFENERENGVLGLINGAAITENMNIFGYIVYDALLTNVNPTAPIQVAGRTLFDSIELTYTSQSYV